MASREAARQPIAPTSVTANRPAIVPPADLMHCGKMQAVDGYEFAAALVGHLTWPALALTVLLVLRKPLAKRVGQLRSVSAGSFAAEFGEAERQVERAIEAEATRSETVEAPGGPEAPSGAEIDRLEDGFREIALRASENPSYSVVASWSLLGEIMASAAADVMPRNIRQRLGSSSPAYTLISALHGQGVISDETTEALNSLRALRNDVAHGKTAPEAGAAVAYVRSVNDIAVVIRSGVDAVWRRRFGDPDASG
ncbi:hypothetical protein K7640_15320 [Micromonospora sp. PLK6-60]|uniref:hypothetical protein n=1 Tax=Micromonospora sp. PLK6-60 TaxID=2873383 RepID=UPI001CA72677|nr:hypothetical protein [Micromonospora sp. PLK6-60]MBY8873205.1 hypothetical protein [Micromonospora sp. PLK6-60]